MIIVFGSIGIEISARAESLSLEDCPVAPEEFTVYPGGSAANQALAAARSGAGVSLISKIGHSGWSDFVLEKLRKDGLKISGVAQSETLPTGVWITLTDGKGAIKRITAPGACMEIKADQIPENTFNTRTLLLLQTEISAEENTALLEKAKAAQATTMMHLAPSIDLSKRALDNLDYLVVNSREAERLAEKLGIAAQESTIKLAQALAQIGKLTCIITQGENGALAVEANGKGWTIGALKLEEPIDKTGVEDCYCGTLAACIQAKLDFPVALKRASIAASLSCMVKGGQTSFPYLDDIDKKMTALEDAREQAL